MKSKLLFAFLFLFSINNFSQNLPVQEYCLTAANVISTEGRNLILDNVKDFSLEDPSTCRQALFEMTVLNSTKLSVHQTDKNLDWARGIVWYQIFPERFADGDTTNEPSKDKVLINSRRQIKDWKVKRWTSDWFEQDKWEKNAGGKFRNHLFDRRYGGDLQGVIDHLDYLKELGVGAIYLNPIFDAVSLHKYDGSTYHHIDINFGPDPERDRRLMESETPEDPSTWKWTSADSLFLKLISEVHKRGMHIIIDGVFNHVGTQFWAFKDVVKNQQNSKYKNWFEIKSFDNSSTKKDEPAGRTGGFDYKGWWNNKSLPQFNRTETDLNPGPKQYIFNATQRWMDPNNDGESDDGIDGWRLDVARDVPMGFWKDWSKLVRSINEKAIIIGELWELSPDFITDNKVFDGLMNYNFAYAVKGLFIDKKNQIKVSDFINKLNEIEKTYPKENLDLLQNLMDSHDTERLSSMIVNPDRQFDHDGNEDNTNYNPKKPSKEDYEIQKLVAAFQMTYKGAPMIYYGDEVGMWSADDPHDRQPMIWDNLKYEDQVITEKSGFKKGFGTYTVEQNKDLLNFYKQLTAIRNENTAIQKGDVKFLYSNDGIKSFAFERQFNNEKIIVVFNLGKLEDQFGITLDNNKYSYKELTSSEEGTLFSSDKDKVNFKIDIAPSSFKIYKFYKL